LKIFSKLFSFIDAPISTFINIDEHQYISTNYLVFNIQKVDIKMRESTYEIWKYNAIYRAFIEW